MERLQRRIAATTVHPLRPIALFETRVTNSQKLDAAPIVSMAHLLSLQLLNEPEQPRNPWAEVLIDLVKQFTTGDNEAAGRAEDLRKLVLSTFTPAQRVSLPNFIMQFVYRDSEAIGVLTLPYILVTTRDTGTTRFFFPYDTPLLPPTTQTDQYLLPMSNAGFELEGRKLKHLCLRLGGHAPPTFDSKYYDPEHNAKLPKKAAPDVRLRSVQAAHRT
jgi:hypothetical protein